MIVAQAGRLAFEALLFAASLRHASPGFRGRLLVAEPQPEAAWEGVDTRIPDPIRAHLQDLGGEIIPFTARHFGVAYPYGNKIEALEVLPAGEPFLFFDTDTLVTGPLDRADTAGTTGTASMRRGPTWPEPPPYGPGYAGIWGSLYDRFGLDMGGSLDRRFGEDDWERYLYFNAGWFFAIDPQAFRQRFLGWALAVRDDPGEALACQKIDVLLDQVVLPLVVHSLGGGRPGPGFDGLDGDLTCHYRDPALLYARESDRAVQVLEEITAGQPLRRLLRDWPAAKEMIHRRAGEKRVRPLFDRRSGPPNEGRTRQQLKKLGLWSR